MKQDQKDRGRYLRGKVLFGFRNGEDGSFVPDPTEDELFVDARASRERRSPHDPAALETQHGRKVSLDALHRDLAGVQEPFGGSAR